MGYTACLPPAISLIGILLTMNSLPNWIPFDQQAFEDSGMDFWVTVTNVETGEPEYIKIDNVFEQMEAFRATSSMPIVSKIVEIEGKKYFRRWCVRQYSGAEIY
ncbi:Uncharacterised protein [Mannheimia haemolytica]|uniref:Uncharacterized protein n=1 Tax=Mannheimia haemolytica TaxID=75985 RepID=A0A378N406_MANHA|nr:Uncharacterised protein [Mannheimia haemolytica]